MPFDWNEGLSARKRMSVWQVRWLSKRIEGNDRAWRCFLSSGRYGSLNADFVGVSGQI